MKKLIIIILFLTGSIVSAQDTIKTIRAREVSIDLLTTAPLEHYVYSIVSKKEFEELLRSGEERNHGQHDHEARLFNEKDFHYFICHPDDRITGKIVFYFYFGPYDTIPSKIFLKKGEVLIFKKGSMKIPEYKDGKK